LLPCGEEERHATAGILQAKSQRLTDRRENDLMSSDEVDRFLALLSHQRKDEIVVLRTAILAADDGIGEPIKWNAPSFFWIGEDRVTMCLRQGHRLGLVFHRGAKMKSIVDLSFGDQTGLIAWATPDRGVLSVKHRAMLDTHTSDIAGLVVQWMKATT